jgi:uncharacterized membrane protein HdeD (DUF308 family)
MSEWSGRDCGANTVVSESAASRDTLRTAPASRRLNRGKGADMNERHPLADFLSSAWWIVLLRGVLAILFGIAALSWPGVTLVTFVTFFGAFALVDGIFDVIHAIRFRKDIEHWGLALVGGIAGIGFGVLVLAAPVATSTAAGVIVALYVAGWAIVTGALRIVMAFRLRKEIEGEWVLGLSGLVSVVLGVWILTHPTAGALGLIWVIGVFALILGLTLVMLAFKVRKVGKSLSQLAKAG